MKYDLHELELPEKMKERLIQSAAKPAGEKFQSLIGTPAMKPRTGPFFTMR